MKNDDNPWRTLASKVAYKNPWMTVYEDQVQMPNGREGIYGFVDGKPGVFIKDGILVDGQSLAALMQFAVWRKIV